MKTLITTAAVVALAAPAWAETVRSQTYEATADRRAVAMKSETGKTIAAQQVIVAVKRLDGAIIGTQEEERTAGFAVKLACGGAAPMLTLPVARSNGTVRYDILCKAGG